MEDKKIKGDHIIVAPHADDEIIGCYKILSEKRVIIIYTGNMSKERQDEALKLKDHSNVKMQFFLRTVPARFLNENNILYYPDPIFETHPLHRQVGSEGEGLVRAGLNVVFYTTNMQAPYIREVELSEQKEKLLNEIYPSQKSLWEYEKKYILFEGRCKWVD